MEKEAWSKFVLLTLCVTNGIYDDYDYDIMAVDIEKNSGSKKLIEFTTPI